jgi:hypothetical protein
LQFWRIVWRVREAVLFPEVMQSNWWFEAAAP